EEPGQHPVVERLARLGQRLLPGLAEPDAPGSVGRGALAGIARHRFPCDACRPRRESPRLPRPQEHVMQLSAIAVPTFEQVIGSLTAILDKAAAHAAAKKIDPAVLIGSRLAPDMYPLSRQVQLVSDFAKGVAARL